MPKSTRRTTGAAKNLKRLPPKPASAAKIHGGRRTSVKDSHDKQA
jgi:hypothetical protein